ncbi:hypothetical protein DMX09_11150 [Pseudomonas protegens]|uniref:anti-phage protein KwaA n=1 Tax=Pseudomonas protegens TaxID=380021 RepID=UPI000D9C25DE|nr:anti-phage protein KwaA [Pseudomonas protegens]PYC05719.1 hypothetical protein DMX09_11150 [Pseudomonas protegens]
MNKKSASSILKFELYIVSLWLLFFLIIIIKTDFPICLESSCKFIGIKELIKTNIIPLISLALLLLGWLFYERFKFRIDGSSGLPIKPEKIEDLNYEHLTFLTTYIIPLICFNLDSVRYSVALLIILFVIGIIYVKTDKFYANPTLAVLGFKLYTIEVSGKKITVITRDKLDESSIITFEHLDEKVVYGRKSK